MKNPSQNSFIEKFNKVLETAKNPEYLILIEITQIESFTSSNRQKSKLDVFGLGGNKTNSVFDLSYLGERDFFNKVFIEYLINNKFPLNKEDFRYDYKKSMSDIAKQFSEYYLWLKELQGKKISKKKNSLTHKQKILMLYYLGLDIYKYDKTSTSKLLHHLLDLDSENTRKYLSYVSGGKNEVRTKNNLQTVHQIFENLGFKKISNTIQKDIENIK